MVGVDRCNLAGRGLISWGDANASTERCFLAHNGGLDPYAHLRGQWEWATPSPSAALTNGKVR